MHVLKGQSKLSKGKSTESLDLKSSFSSCSMSTSSSLTHVEKLQNEGPFFTAWRGVIKMLVEDGSAAEGLSQKEYIMSALTPRERTQVALLNLVLPGKFSTTTHEHVMPHIRMPCHTSAVNTLTHLTLSNTNRTRLSLARASSRRCTPTRGDGL
jgi:hypothetical protein